MGAKFSEEEKIKIRKMLLDVGEKYFTQYGFDKTNILEITDEIGIAKGTFYHFFDSKEAFMFEILYKIESKFQHRMIAEIEKRKMDNKEALKYYMHHFINEMENNIIFNEAYSLKGPKVFGNLENKIKKSNISKDVEMVRYFLEKTNYNGLDIDIEVLVGMLRTIGLIASSKEAIGEDVYKNVVNEFLDMIANKYLL